MLKIGFARKYFTLWDVTSFTEYGQGSTGTYSYTRTVYTFHQNLSINEEKAKQKASEKGVKDLTVDTELFGRSGRSFEKVSPREYVKYEDTQFSYGKYVGEYFDKSEDVDYLDWFYKDSGNINAAKRLVELDDYYLIENGELITQDVLESRKISEKIESQLKKDGFVEIFVERNVDSYGFLNVDGVSFNFGEVRENYYNGWDYYLPVLNGKQKRIKKKTLKVYAELGKVSDFETWKVSNFEILTK